MVWLSAMAFEMLAEAPDYSIAISSPACTKDNVFQFNTSLGKDVTRYAVLVFSGDAKPSEENFKLTAQTGDVFQRDQAFSLNMSGKSYKPYRCVAVMAVSIDENRNMLEGTKSVVYIGSGNGTEMDGWIELKERARFTDPVMCSLFDMEQYTYDVTVAKNPNNHNKIRIINPYGNGTPFQSFNTHSDDHPHYIEISIIDDNHVSINNTPIGIDVLPETRKGEGTICIFSQSPDRQAWGTLKGNTVTFTGDQVLVRRSSYDNAEWQTCDNHDFILVLPDEAFINYTVKVSVCPDQCSQDNTFKAELSFGKDAAEYCYFTTSMVPEDASYEDFIK